MTARGQPGTLIGLPGFSPAVEQRAETHCLHLSDQAFPCCVNTGNGTLGAPRQVADRV